MKKKTFLLKSQCERLTEELTAEDLIAHGIPRSSAYRAIKSGVMPRHRIRLLQFRLFGDLTGWNGWKISHNGLIDPAGQVYEPRDLENLRHLKNVLSEKHINYPFK